MIERDYLETYEKDKDDDDGDGDNDNTEILEKDIETDGDRPIV